MNTPLRNLFALVLNCSYPVITALDFVFAKGKVEVIWPYFATKLGVASVCMNPGEHGRYKWGENFMKVIFTDHSFDVRFGDCNWHFRFGDANILDEFGKVCETLHRLR